MATLCIMPRYVEKLKQVLLSNHNYIRPSFISYADPIYMLLKVKINYGKRTYYEQTLLNCKQFTGYVPVGHRIKESTLFDKGYTFNVTVLQLTISQLYDP